MKKQDGHYTRPATWDDVVHVCRLLNEAGAKYMLIGGYAVFAHGFNRQSDDIDILVNPILENQKKWVFALSELPDKAAKKLENEGNVFEPDYTMAIRINNEVTIDVMPAAGGKNWETLKKHVETIQSGGITIPVLSIEGLLLTKQGFRPKDQMDRSVLERAMKKRGVRIMRFAPDQPGSPDQQPIKRIVGRKEREPSTGGAPLFVSEERIAFSRQKTRSGIAPKGVFCYRSHAQANDDMERWVTESMSRFPIAKGQSVDFHDLIVDSGNDGE